MSFEKGYIPWNKGKNGIYSKISLEKMSRANRGKIPWNRGLRKESDLRVKQSEITKEKISKKLKDRIPWNKELNIEKDPRILKMSKSMKETWKIHGHPRKGKKHSEESKKKMSETIKRKIRSGEIIIPERVKFKKNIPSWNKNKPWPEETKKKMSKSHLGKISGMKNKKHREESKKKMSISHLGKTTWMKGKKHLKKTREKISNSRLNQIFPREDTIPEKTVQKYLSSIKYQKHYPIQGQPDIAIPEKKIAIFVDGCYWHGCKECFLSLDEKQVKWVKKDQRNNEFLRKDGWKVIRIWEHEIKKGNFEKLNIF